MADCAAAGAPGLHDAQKGIIENTPSAFAAAMAGRYGIECDLQITADGEAMVRSAIDRRRAERYADQMIFEGFRP